MFYTPGWIWKSKQNQQYRFLIKKFARFSLRVGGQAWHLFSWSASD